MTAETSVRRRTLRPTCTAALIEGAVSRRRAAPTISTVSVEIVGGPLGAALAVIIGGGSSRTLQLDACGFGTLQLDTDAVEVDVRHADQTILFGRIPSLTTSTRVRP